MGTLNVRTDEAVETALAALTGEERSRPDAVRSAVLRTYREVMLERAREDADRSL